MSCGVHDGTKPGCPACERRTYYTFTMRSPGYTSVSTDGARPHSVAMTVEGDSNLTELLSRFAEFLRGCGFVVGELEEVEPDP